MLKLTINNLEFEFNLYNEVEETFKFDNYSSTTKRKQAKSKLVLKGESDDEHLIYGIREDNNCGLTYRSKDKVFINEALPKDLMLFTITHELTHCYIWAYGMNQFGSLDEEQLCDFMGAFSSNITRDANIVFTYFCKELDKNNKKRTKNESK